MMGCRKCQGMCGVSMAIAGVLYLLQDLTVITFWKINWWTVVFLLMGIGTLAMSSCPDCRVVMSGKKK